MACLYEKYSQVIDRWMEKRFENITEMDIITQQENIRMMLRLCECEDCRDKKYMEQLRERRDKQWESTKKRGSR